MVVVGILLIGAIWLVTFFVMRGVYLSARKADGQELPTRLPRQ